MATLKIFVDTNVIIDFGHGKSVFLANLLFNQSKDATQLFINAIVIAEYFTDKNLKDTKKHAVAEEFIANFRVLSINKKEGLLAAKFMREGLTFSVDDALIAASCLVNNMTLATRNKKHFEKISGLKFV